MGIRADAQALEDAGPLLQRAGVRCDDACDGSVAALDFRRDEPRDTIPAPPPRMSTLPPPPPTSLGVANGIPVDLCEDEPVDPVDAPHPEVLPEDETIDDAVSRERGWLYRTVSHQHGAR